MSVKDLNKKSFIVQRDAVERDLLLMEKMRKIMREKKKVSWWKKILGGEAIER